MKIRLMAEGQDYDRDRSASSRRRPSPVDELGVGEVGFLVANIKNIADAKIGDTITETARPTARPFPGFKELKPMVFAGLYPVEATNTRSCATRWRSSPERCVVLLRAETSIALGFGFRCGFLGLLHMEIVAGAARAVRNLAKYSTTIIEALLHDSPCGAAPGTATETEAERD